MARHQIIYTSCMRGIDGANDGQQVFSYDKSFADSKADEIKGLFAYQVPSLPSGVIMSEEIAKTMPAAFSYRRLKSGNAAVSLNTYLGRDYMGSSGRFGNQLCHSIVCDYDDFDIYPCEMYKSTELRSSMEFAEVNNPEPPAYLPEPELTKGYAVNLDSVLEFLEIGDNMEYFEKMFNVMLKFPQEKKRIIICDEPDNIVKWIAALHYTLPLDIAKNVNFTSYEYDPELSFARICGVVTDGTRYNADAYISSGHHYVFDFVNNKFSKVEKGDNIFEFFVDTSFRFSYSSMQEFHEFVMSKTTYREAGADYYSAYYLYNLLTGEISQVSLAEFRQIESFVENYTEDGTRQEIVNKLTEQKDKICRLDTEYAMSVIDFLLKYGSGVGAVCSGIIEGAGMMDYFVEHVISADDGYREKVSGILLDSGKSGEVFEIYRKRMEATSTLAESRAVFKAECTGLVSKYDCYRTEYANPVLSEYEDIFAQRKSDVPEEEAFGTAREMAHMAMKLGIADESMEAAMQNACSYIALKKPSEENIKIIDGLYSYHIEKMDSPIEGRMMLLVTGVSFDGVNELSKLDETVDRLLEESGHKGADISLAGDEAEKYIEWILGNAFKFSLTAGSLTGINSLLVMDETVHEKFIEYCCKASFKKVKNTKEEKDCTDFAEFIRFLSTEGKDSDTDISGKHLCKLNKQKLEELDGQMKEYLGDDTAAVARWEQVRDVASGTNPVLNTLSGLFKRK